MSAVGRPGGFANVGRGRYATRPGSGRWVIANHLLVEKAQTRAQMLHQWDQRPYTDARQIGRVRAESDRRLGKVRRRDPNRPLPSVRQRDNDVGGTASRPLLQHLKPVPKKKMMRVSDRDVRHDPFKNRGTLSCSVIPPSAMRYWTASFTMPTASSSKATVYGVRLAKRKNREHLAHDWLFLKYAGLFSRCGHSARKLPCNREMVGQLLPAARERDLLDSRKPVYRQPACQKQSLSSIRSSARGSQADQGTDHRVCQPRRQRLRPPQQALNWITDAYENEEEIRVRGQSIIYMVHNDV